MLYKLLSDEFTLRCARLLRYEIENIL